MLAAVIPPRLNRTADRRVSLIVLQVVANLPQYIVLCNPHVDAVACR